MFVRSTSIPKMLKFARRGRYNPGMTATCDAEPPGARQLHVRVAGIPHSVRNHMVGDCPDDAFVVIASQAVPVCPAHGRSGCKIGAFLTRHCTRIISKKNRCCEDQPCNPSHVLSFSVLFNARAGKARMANERTLRSGPYIQTAGRNPMRSAKASQCACSLLSGACLERFSNSRGVTSVVQSGFCFHPCDEDLSPGTPERKKPPKVSGFPLHQLENRYRVTPGSTSADKRSLPWLCTPALTPNRARSRPRRTSPAS